jgi:ElaB/YqjD/DUF883 family membrane-anchored ribosome-binding protein
MGEDPQTIRRDIEETRERMGETVDALGYKTDVKTRTKEAVSDRARRAGGMAKENPLGLAIGSAAVGFIAGLAIPTTRVEEEKLAPKATELREKAMDAGQEAVDRGKEVAQEAISSAKETARERGQEQAQEMREQVSS